MLRDEAGERRRVGFRTWRVVEAPSAVLAEQRVVSLLDDADPLWQLSSNSAADPPEIYVEEVRVARSGDTFDAELDIEED